MKNLLDRGLFFCGFSISLRKSLIDELGILHGMMRHREEDEVVSKKI